MWIVRIALTWPYTIPVSAVLMTGLKLVILAALH